MIFPASLENKSVGKRQQVIRPTPSLSARRHSVAIFLLRCVRISSRARRRLLWGRGPGERIGREKKELCEVSCPMDRILGVDGPPRLVNVTETAQCEYTAVIEVPLTTCQQGIPCCTPSVYAASRMQSDGSIAAYQADGEGKWFDQNYKNGGKSMLCLKSYNRCFSFSGTQCEGMAFQAPPVQCYGVLNVWQFVKNVNVGDNSLQSLWYWRSDGSYAFTTPVPSSSTSSCLVASGNKVDSSFDFSVSPNATLWEIPLSCLKQVI